MIIIRTMIKTLVVVVGIMIYNIPCFAQRNVTIGLQGGPSWGDYDNYNSENGNIMLATYSRLSTPRVGGFIDMQVVGNFHAQIGVDYVAMKTRIEGRNMGTTAIRDVDGIINEAGEIYYKYNYTATEELHLKYFSIPLYATYHLLFNPRFKLIYGLGAAYRQMLKMDNKVVVGSQLISNRKFKDYDMVLSAFHMAEFTFCNQWSFRIGIYYDQGIVNIDSGTRPDNLIKYRVLSRYFGANMGITYNLSKLKAN